MDEEVRLSDEQSRVLELIKEGKNVFITGGAGTGKSYLIKEIYNELKHNSKKTVYLTSSTGVSALNIGGTTLHKYIGCGLAEESAEILYNKLKKNKAALIRIKGTDTIIIDEISMINSEFFNKINYLLQKVMNDDFYFGGKQIIAVGDFFQLPPIFKNKQERTYLFHTDIWRNLFDEIIELKFVFRQKDDTIYSNLLNRIRYGELNIEDEKLLKSRLNIINRQDILSGKTTLNSVPIFYPLRTDAKNLNMEKFDKLKTKKQYNFKTKFEMHGNLSEYVTNNIIQNFKLNSIVDQEIRLKIGTQVMLVANVSMKKGLVNGTIGKIIKFEYSDEDYLPVLLYRNSKGKIKEEIINKYEWKKGNNDKDCIKMIQKHFIKEWGLNINKNQFD